MIPKALMTQLPLDVLLALESGELSPIEVQVLHRLALTNIPYLFELSERQTVEDQLKLLADRIMERLDETIDALMKASPEKDRNTMKQVAFHHTMRAQALEMLLDEIVPKPLAVDNH